LISAIGGIQFDTFEKLEKIPSSQLSNYCCLYHLLISLESKDNLFTISNFVNNIKFSNYFIEFLCKTLSFDNNLFFTLQKNSINSHPWLKSYLNANNFSQTTKTKIKLSEVIKMVRDSKKSPRTYSDTRVDYLLNNISIILSNNKSTMGINHPLNNELSTFEDIDKFLNSKQVTIKEVVYDLGTNINDFLVLTKKHILSK